MQGVGIGFGINGNCFNVQLLAGTDNADGDFASVGDENSLEHKCFPPQILWCNG